MNTNTRKNFVTNFKLIKGALYEKKKLSSQSFICLYLQTIRINSTTAKKKLTNISIYFKIYMFINKSNYNKKYYDYEY